jgi:hypothetical protein
VTSTPSALAVVDGTLRQLTRQGAPSGHYAPLATAVVEIHPGPMCVYVREHPYGLLPGIPNLYCLDHALRLQWMAEWPDPADPCAKIISADGDTLTVATVSSAVVRLHAHDGRLLGVVRPLAAVS